MGVITLGTGWFCLHRQLNEHWIYKDSEHLKVWLEMLMCARYHKEPKTDTYEGVLYTLNYGEFIYGRISWGARLGISEQKLRTLIKKLVSDGMIVLILKHSKFSIYKIQNFEKFNQHSNQQNNQQNEAENEGFEGMCNQQNNQHSNHHLTSTQPAPNQQLTTNKQINKVNKETNKDICNAPNVKLSEDEYNKLIDKLGESKTLDMCERLSLYIQQIGVKKAESKYKSHYAVILNWCRMDKQKRGEQGAGYGKRYSKTDSKPINGVGLTMSELPE